MSNGRRSGSSIFAGLLLVLIGVLFLIAIYYPEVRLGHLIAVYWPVLLIIWGVAKVIDYLLAPHRGERKPAVVSGGEAVLIVVLVLVLGGFVIRDWVRDRVPHFNFDLPEFGPSYSQNESLPAQTIPQNARLAIYTPRGDIAVQGGSGNQLLVSAKRTTWGASKTAAERAMRGASVRIDNSGGVFRINATTTYRAQFGEFSGRRSTPEFGVIRRDQANVDLNVQAPRDSNVAASTNRGDVKIDGISGGTQVHSSGGDVEVQNAGANVEVALTHGDVRIAGVTGNVRVTGRGDDVNISAVTGNAAVQGPFYGTIRAQNVAQTLTCAVPWSQITIEKLTGTIETDLGDLHLSGADGPVKIATHNSDVKVENATGRLNIADAHGDIAVTLTAPPREDINITNDAGDVDVTLPAGSAFEAEAISRGGDVESDFDQLNTSTSNGNGQITGHVGASGGPRITIATTYGTIHLRKTSSGR